jgi:hypothetical protein
LTISAVLGRLRGHKDVLFICDGSSPWKVYRCDHQAEQLEFLGISSDIVQRQRVGLMRALDHYDTFVLNRIEWTDDVGAFIGAAREAGKAVIFGTDDLIFEPSLAGQFAFLADASDADRAAWRRSLEGYRRTLRACDGAIVSTDPLAEHARRHVGDVRVVHNAVSAEMVRAAEDAVASRTVDRGVVTIGYLSGTPSHDRDFAEAADAVAWALQAYQQTRFQVVGPLNLDPRFERFGPRVTRLPKRPFAELPKLFAGIDINLAPLEPGNPFTECKSCAKYLEAGLVGVPTIAGRHPDFLRAIDSGRNGMLAGTAEEWREALRALIESQSVRRHLGNRALEDVHAHQTTTARASELGLALVALAEARSLQAQRR